MICCTLLVGCKLKFYLRFKEGNLEMSSENSMLKNGTRLGKIESNKN